MSTTASLPCAAGTLRRATRSVSRLYDTHLAHAGLTTTQYSLLVSLGRRRAPVPLTELAAEQMFERTSLYRALEPLRRDGLIALTAGTGRNRNAALTPRGARRLADAQPHWRDAQSAFLRAFGRSEWSGLAAQITAMIASVAPCAPASPVPAGAQQARPTR